MVISASARGGRFLDKRLHVIDQDRVGEVAPGSQGIDEALREDVLRAVLQRQDTERQRIARELHDVIGQALTYVRLSLEASRMRVRDPDAVHRLTESIEAIDRAIADVRSFAVDLRPAVLDDLGLVAAVRSALARSASASGFAPVLIAEESLGPIDTAVEVALFRIVREALTNVERHAEAHHVEIRLGRTGPNLVAAIRDDGVGFRPAHTPEASATTLGLIGMTERARLVGGRVTVASVPGRGTTVTATLPIDQGSARACRGRHRLGRA